MRSIAWIGLIALCLVACDDKRVYEVDHDFPDRAWRSTDTATFSFVIPDSTLKYNLYYNVRNSLDYPVSRLFVQYALSDSTGNNLGKELVSTDLFEKSGKPLGESGLGDVYDHQIPLIKNIHFRHRGTYVLKLQQFMRLDTLKGVLSVGVRIEDATGK